MASKVYLALGLVLLCSCVDYSNAKDADVANNENKMGMEALYEMVHFFLGDIVQTKNISESFLNLSTVFVDNKFDKDQLTDWKKWIEYGKGYAAGTVVGLLFIVLMPIVGLVFCCCRLCGRCGGRPRLHDTRRSKCKRRTYCTLVLVFNTLALAGVVCAFMCSTLIHKSLQNEQDEGTIGHIRSSLLRIKSFTDNAVVNVSSTVTGTFEEIANNALTSINDTAFHAVDNVLATLNATQHLDKARHISVDVNETKLQMDVVGQLVGELSTESKQLQNNLTDIKNEIQAVCNATNSCDGFNPADYNTEADFSTLDGLQKEAQKVANSMDMSAYIKEAEDQIHNAREKTKEDIDGTIQGAKDSINVIREVVEDGVEELVERVDDAMGFYQDADADLHQADQDMKDKYADYIYYSCIGVSCVYLLIVVLYYLGVVFGLCGERPGHDAPCCNRGVGSRFLMAGSAFTFIFSWLLMFLCMVLFIVGGISYTEVCRYFHGHDPSNFKVFDETLERGLHISKTLYNNPAVKFSLSNSIRQCQENQALYSAFQMDYIVNLDSIIDIQPLKTELDRLQDSSVDNIPDVVIINDKLRSDLNGFANSGIQSINFDKYFAELNKSLTKVDVDVLSGVIRTISQDSANAAYKATLERQAERLKELKEQSIPSLTQNANSLRNTVTELQSSSKIASSITSLINDMEKSQQKFNSDKKILVKQEIQVVADHILVDTNVSVDHLKSKIRNKIAQCDALSDSLYSVSDSVCVLLVDPLNGLWFSFGWCLFFFVLCIIFGVLLAGEYRHELKYGKEFDDPFDSRNHDMMPLTRRMDC